MSYPLLLLSGYLLGNRLPVYLGVLLLAWLSGVVNPLADFERLRKFDAGQPEEMPSLEEMASLAARRHGLEPGLFRALIAQESAWNPSAVSAKGATGLAQLMPATARDHCGLALADLIDPDKNLDCGARYLAAQIARFGALDLALAAYNAGPERIARLGRVPRIPETQNYVANILANWKREV